MNDIAAALSTHKFRELFVEVLGWDRFQTPAAIDYKGQVFDLEPVAQKRGFAVFACRTHRTVLANRRLLRTLQKRLTKSYHEHILIFYCETPFKQVWQWVMEATAEGRIQHRDHPFFSNSPPPRLLERLERLAVSLSEEEQTTLSDVLVRVREALLPDREFDLFAKSPWYAAKSDELAMAMKRGEPGAFQAFVELHQPLARCGAKMLVRWVGMDQEDAEQIAMLGILEAARRFDPERGYQFSTYAGYWIRQACQRYGIESAMVIRWPGHLFLSCYRLEFIRAELTAAYGEYGAKERFARELGKAGVSERNWARFCAVRNTVAQVDAKQAERAQLSRLADDEAASSRVFLESVRDDVRAAVEGLRKRHAEILKFRYGLGRPELTLQQVAQIWGLSTERVRQIQEKAEEKLLQALRRRGYDDNMS